ncbi:MAG: translation initiation factor IF-2, partial [Deltaproteobacteria bacterium]|nr:translation initiation factor IF-2 [Deltaproteobacteria bacterium]
MSKTHVYELAKKMGIENKELIARLKSLGIEVKSHLSVLEDEDVQKLASPPAPPKGVQQQEEVRVTTTVIRRRPKAVAPSSEEIAPVSAETVEPAPPEEVSAPGAEEPMAPVAPEVKPEVAPQVEAPKAEEPKAEESKVAVEPVAPKPAPVEEEKPTMNRARILGRVELPGLTPAPKPAPKPAERREVVIPPKRKVEERVVAPQPTAPSVEDRKKKAKVFTEA